MKNLFVAAVLFAATSAFAQVHHDVIYQRCEDEHKRGVCRAMLDRSVYPPGATRVVPGRGLMSMNAYLNIRNAGASMCTIARAYCSIEPTGDECFEAHLLWGRVK